MRVGAKKEHLSQHLATVHEPGFVFSFLSSSAFNFQVREREQQQQHSPMLPSRAERMGRRREEDDKQPDGIALKRRPG
jgi:hypothetical protein